MHAKQQRRPDECHTVTSYAVIAVTRYSVVSLKKQRQQLRSVNADTVWSERRHLKSMNYLCHTFPLDLSFTTIESRLVRSIFTVLET